MKFTNFAIKLILIIFFVLPVYSCKRSNKQNLGKVEGYKPIYNNESAVVEVQPPTAYVYPDKIIQLGDISFQLDKCSGIHVIDASDKLHPVKVKFIKVPGITELCINNNTLIGNMLQDIVLIDVSNINTIKVTKTIPKALNQNNILPPESNAYFECIDSTKGTLVGWYKTKLNNPRCISN